MKESAIESHLKRKGQALGWKVYKWVSGETGVPDRILVHRKHGIWFVEVKREDGRLTPIQLFKHAELREHGAQVEVVWSKRDVDRFYARFLF